MRLCTPKGFDVAANLRSKSRNVPWQRSGTRGVARARFSDAIEVVAPAARVK
jgi:hypothetical protein